MRQAPFGAMLSKSDFARHRGVSPAMVTNWRKNGRIVVTEDGQVDVEASDRMLDASQDPSRGGSVGREERSAAEMPSQPSATASFTEVRTKREEFTLKSQEIEYRQRVGELVEREEYNRGMAQNLGPALKRFDTISARLGARLAAESDVRKCQDMLDDEIASIRQEIADSARAMIEGAGKTKQ